MTDSDRAKAYSAALAIQKQVDALLESLEPVLLLTYREFCAMQRQFIENGGSWGIDHPTRYSGYRFYVDHSLMDDPELNDMYIDSKCRR